MLCYLCCMNLVNWLVRYVAHMLQLIFLSPSVFPQLFRVSTFPPMPPSLAPSTRRLVVSPSALPPPLPSLRLHRATRASRLEACKRRYRVSSPALSESGFSPRVSRLVSSLAGWMAAGWLARSLGADYIGCPQVHFGFSDPSPAPYPHLSPTTASFGETTLPVRADVI